jgi:hypothetical protein
LAGRADLVGAFLLWAARRIGVLVRNGLGITSTIASLGLLVVPTFSPGWSRWWAVGPILVYVVGALLWDEYVRESRACLTATLTSEKIDNWTRHWLEIQNCGAGTVKDADWELLGQPPGWDIEDQGMARPHPELLAGEKFRLPVILSMGCDVQATVRLRGVAGGREYQRDKLVTTYG